jgi:hypothetical protein
MEVGNAISSILPMMAMKDGVRTKDIRDVVKQLLLIDVGTKMIPFMLGRVVNHFRTRAVSHARDDLPKDAKVKSASIQIHRIYDKNNENDTFDAIIWRLCQLPQTKHLKLASNGIYVLSNNDIILIEDDIHIKQLSIAFNEKKEVTESSIEIFSYKSDLLGLKDYIIDIVHKFNVHRNNQLGQTIYYFDEIPTSLPRTIEKTVNYDIAPKQITFTMSKLCTNKTLENVYGKSMEVVRKRVRFFMNNKKWYQEKGVPYTLGILMYGEPGCGKTSLIKGLSKECQRHIFNIKLSEESTTSQINNLFFTEKVTTLVDGVNTSFNIPIDKRIYVIEDIDCLSNIVLSRDLAQAPAPPTNAFTFSVPYASSNAPASASAYQATTTAYQATTSAYQAANAPASASGFQPYSMTGSFSMFEEIPKSAPPQGSQPQDAPQHSQKLTLSFLLNVLDGVLETPGRIVILTSNHPEKLDKALVRPGRIDLKVHFQRCTKEDIKETILKITGKTVTDEDLDGIEDYQWTPAELTQKIFEHIDGDINDIIEQLKRKH